MDILSPEEELRYNRQIILRQFDFDGQEALKKGSILVLGAGGLGCAATQYLAASGIGKITLIDDDIVELSNLQRQVLHNDSSIGVLKVESAAANLRKINPHTKVETIAKRLNDEALQKLIQSHDLVMDCSDNVETRNQLNRLCFKLKKPLVSGAAIRLEGQIAVFTYSDDEPCYQCLSALFGEQSLSCLEAGILSPVIGIIGACQALEAIKLLSGFAPPPTRKVMLYDALSSEWRDFNLPKSPTCPVCNN
ncbi:molybdopterin-synthase adenylyltransferase MoeB [Grimontia sp. NTOU-MAR1]|uniref:molybdopterin-synthase adenylyltransferase MoeB n=1 Tax=Grimontia sp. NTOU-MAR1 TaxID=3111011 RepID=UPI002DC050A5|nr:molybdopterin-synthase adenylyltransferase MoeB [Grimontia sp. NTOU-MAR1]WRV97994.1 molybdopterin-synthase adenylyltransferase MoeB [Grimontia sp. NTOU-MAR1]